MLLEFYTQGGTIPLTFFEGCRCAVRITTERNFMEISNAPHFHTFPSRLSGRRSGRGPRSRFADQFHACCQFDHCGTGADALISLDSQTERRGVRDTPATRLP